MNTTSRAIQYDWRDNEPVTEYTRIVEQRRREKFADLPTAEGWVKASEGVAEDFRAEAQLHVMWDRAMRERRAGFLPEWLHPRFYEVCGQMDARDEKFHVPTEKRRKKMAAHNPEVSDELMSVYGAAHHDEYFADSSVQGKFAQLVIELMDARMEQNPALSYRQTRVDAFREAKRRRPDLWRKLEAARSMEE